MSAENQQAPNVMLVGGPKWTAQSLPRICYTGRLDAELKLQVGNRYEHFLPTSQHVIVEGRKLVVFEWTTFTQVAE